MSKPVVITLLSKPGCHLCDDARVVINRVRGELAGRGIVATLDERNILADVQLARLHSEDIPVVLIGGRRHAIWRVDAQKLTRAVERASGWRGVFLRDSSTPVDR
ncbi:glutaredoxin family protein [Leucobacter sp. W1478]|uniref:glutaredoxin family protein n=1 Tax=Leucobacter sp. W1478 TaxID=3439065 RepID=UPI003F397646